LLAVEVQCNHPVTIQLKIILTL